MTDTPILDRLNARLKTPKYTMTEKPHPLLKNYIQRLYQMESGKLLSAVRPNDSQRWEVALMDSENNWLTRRVFDEADKIESDTLHSIPEDQLIPLLNRVEAWEIWADQSN